MVSRLAPRLALTVMVCLLLFSLSNARAATLQYGPVMVNTASGPSASDAMYTDVLNNVIMGRAVGETFNYQSGAFDVTPDLLFWADHPRLFTRSLLLEDTGDPPDLALRRNDGIYPNGARQPIGAGINLGTIYWQPWDGTAFHVTNPDGSLRDQGRTAAIYSRTAVVPSQTNRAGSLVFATAREGELSARDSVIITPRGTLELQEHGDWRNPAVYFAGDPDTGLYQRAPDELSILARGNEAMRVSDAGNNEAGIWLLTSADGVRRIQRVEVGPPDSGGPGYRALRVGN